MFCKWAGLVLMVCAVAVLAPGGASAATTFGEDISTAPTMSNPGTGITRAYMDDGSVNPGSPVGGVLTSVAFRSNGEASWGWVRVIRRTGPYVSGAADFVTIVNDIYWEATADATPSGHTTTIPTRVTIQAGDQLAMVNANENTNLYYLASAPADCASAPGAEIGVTVSYTTDLCNHWIPILQGTVEPDADGDGYGDETQDECPSNPATQEDCPPVGAVFVGDDFDTPPAWVLNSQTITRSLAENGSDYTGFDTGGVLTEVQVLSSGGAGTAAVHVLRNTTALGSYPIDFLNVGPDVSVSVPAAASPGTVTSVPTRQTVQPGDRFALTNNSLSASMHYVSPGSGDCVLKAAPPPAPGAVASFTDIGCNEYIPAVRGVVEPDADGDDFGDVSQDSCPTDATTQSACPGAPTTSQADLAVSIKRAKRPVPGLRASLLVKITNKGPAVASGIRVSIDRSRRLETWSLAPNGKCARTKSRRSCSVESLAPRASLTIRARAVKRISGRVALVARVGSVTGDPVKANNKSRTVVRFHR